jgi:hypothetical protein
MFFLYYNFYFILVINFFSLFLFTKAVRFRPLVPKETKERSQQCISKVFNQPQVNIQRPNEAFSFTYDLAQKKAKAKVYDIAAKSIVGKIL